MNLSCSTAMLITCLRLRVSYASDRCLIFKDWNAPKYITGDSWIKAFLFAISAGTSLGERLCRCPGSRAGARGRACLGGRVRGLDVTCDLTGISPTLLVKPASS